MARSGNQTEKGKAFEYACAKAIQDGATAGCGVEIVKNSSLTIAEGHYSSLTSKESSNDDKGAGAAIRFLSKLEPRLYEPNSDLLVELQEDSKGKNGDVRDIICSRDDWNLGISCKHNNNAVKHSRISPTIDFGYKWVGINCSDDYVDDVKDIFKPIIKMIEDSKKNKTILQRWRDVKNKHKDYYVPALNAFIKELKKLDNDNPGVVPERLIRYLLGREDFYKVIMYERKKYTKIEAININGTLNKPSGKTKAVISAPRLKMPTRFTDIRIKDGSTTTVLIECDNGWNLSMRVHSGDGKVVPSLKFDVRMISFPSNALVHYEPW